MKDVLKYLGHLASLVVPPVFLLLSAYMVGYLSAYVEMHYPIPEAVLSDALVGFAVGLIIPLMLYIGSSMLRYICAVCRNAKEWLSRPSV